jgi:hypothetical protein
MTFLTSTDATPSVMTEWMRLDQAGLMTHILNGIGSTPQDSILLTNTTAAANAAQQYSPAFEQKGNAWVLQTAPTAPTSGAPTSGGSCTAGTHYWLATYVNATGETTMGAISAVQTCVTTSGQTVPLTAIPVGPSGQVTGRNIYVSKAGAAHALYTDFYLACASAPCIADNTTTTFSFTLADASLGANPPSVNGTGNSQSVGFRSYVVPVQGTTTGASYWGLFYHPPSGADVNMFTCLPGGQCNIGPIGAPASTSDAYPGLKIYGNSGAYGLTIINGFPIITLTVGSNGNTTTFGYSSSNASPQWCANGFCLQGYNGFIDTGRFNITPAPTATANYGTLSIGNGPFDGTTTGKFVGSVSGTSIAVNEVTGYGGDLFNVQVAGVSQAKVSATGLLTLAGSTFVLGGHTCSIVSTVLTCP